MKILKNLTLLAAGFFVSSAPLLAEPAIDGSFAFVASTNLDDDDDNIVAARGSVVGDFSGATKFQFDLAFSNQHQDDELGTSLTAHVIYPVGESAKLGVVLGNGIRDEDGVSMIGVEAKFEVANATVEALHVTEYDDGDFSDSEKYYLLRGTLPFAGRWSVSTGYMSLVDDDETFAELALAYGLKSNFTVEFSAVRGLDNDEEILRLGFSKVFGDGAIFENPSREVLFDDL